MADAVIDPLAGLDGYGKLEEGQSASPPVRQKYKYKQRPLR